MIPYEFCTKGHLNYILDRNVKDQVCSLCREELVRECGKCLKKIGSFIIGTYLPAIKRVSTSYKTERPKFCDHCGEILPWTKNMHDKIDGSGIWKIINPEVRDVSKTRFDTGHYADAVESVFKHINSKIKKIYKYKTGTELDGVSLMRKTFTPSEPVIVIDNLETETGKNIQQGYMELFSGSISAIRNPKAHENIEISADECVHFLFLASLLLNKLHEAQIR